MFGKLSWRPDLKPDSETLVKYYEKLDRQVREIRNQFQRGVLAPLHVQALIEHRRDIFPEQFWTVRSTGQNLEELLAACEKNGYDVDGPRRLLKDKPKSAPEVNITTGITYYLVGMKFPKLAEDEHLTASFLAHEAERRGYRRTTREAALLLMVRYSPLDIRENHLIFFHEPAQNLDENFFRMSPRSEIGYYPIPKKYIFNWDIAWFNEDEMGWPNWNYPTFVFEAPVNGDYRF